MSDIRFRLAKPSDAKQIANCHWHVRDRYTEGIFLSLGENFLRAYYKVIMDDPNEIIVCAENSEGEIVGFSSGSLNAESQAETIKKHRIRLGLSALLGIIRHPSYLKGVWQRYKSLQSSEGPKFLHLEGARSEYLCWKKGADGSISMLLLDKLKFKIMHELGIKEVYFEIDKNNERWLSAVLRDKTNAVQGEYPLPDGRIRVLIKKSI